MRLRNEGRRALIGYLTDCARDHSSPFGRVLAGRANQTLLDQYPLDDTRIRSRVGPRGVGRRDVPQEGVVFS